MPPALPSGVAARTAGYLWYRDLIGESGGSVYRLAGDAGSGDLFLKHGRDSAADDVTDEAVRLLWLTDRMPVPYVVHFERTGADAWLLMTALPGRTAYQVLEDEPGCRTGTVRAVARFLRNLHSVPVDACPFTSDAAHRLSRARERIDAGLVEEDDFDGERQGWTAGQVWDAMIALLPLAPDPVVTHGDFSLDNLLLEGGEVVGLIDLGRVGIADRWQDLAILWNCLGEFDPTLRDVFLDAYGVKCDVGKLRFHLMLDECF